MLEKLRYYYVLFRQRDRDGHLTFWRQFIEMTSLALLTGNGPGFYQMAGFWRRSVSWSDKRKHLSAHGYAKRIAQLNPVKYRKISQYKLSEKGMLELLGFPTPQFLGFLHAENGRTHLGSPLRNGADVIRLLEEQSCERACFKLVEGWAGRGFEAVDVIRKNGEFLFRCASDGELVDPESFCAQRILGDERSRGAVIERYLEQHASMARFNPSSVNTLRIWVIEREHGPTSTVLAYLRIGRAGSLIDNQSCGGIVAPIEIDTGLLGIANDGLPERLEFSTHPDHDAAIEGLEIPFWEQSKILAEAALAAFPNMHFSGIDIAVTNHGPVVIEMNPMPDREGAAFVGVPSAIALSRRTKCRENSPRSIFVR